MPFQVGDRVRCIYECPDDNEEIHIGDTGTVCKVEIGILSVGVNWDHRMITGHHCNGYCPEGHGWFVRVSDVELISEASTDADTPAIDIDAMNALFREVV